MRIIDCKDCMMFLDDLKGKPVCFLLSRTIARVVECPKYRKNTGKTGNPKYKRTYGYMTMYGIKKGGH